MFRSQISLCYGKVLSYFNLGIVFNNTIFFKIGLDFCYYVLCNQDRLYSDMVVNDLYHY